jgi:hypothetical protein
VKRALGFVVLAACGTDHRVHPDGAGQGGGDGGADDGAASIDAGIGTCAPATDPYGRCAGDVLHTCSGSVDTATNCAASGQSCAWVGDTIGYACVDPMTAPLAVSGTITYEDKPPKDDGSLGAITPRPARGARVSVVRDSDSMVLAAGTVADDGSYRLRYTADVGTMVHIMAAATSALAARPIRVITRQSVVHGFGGASFAAAMESTADVLVTDASKRSEAFNILDQLVGTMDSIRIALGDATPVPLAAQWEAGSTDGTYYSGKTVHLLGRSSDDDGYDDTVILHESGHYVEDTQGRSDSPGGSHDGSPTDPRLAWSEGFSTYWAMAVRGAPHYMDSNSGGGWGYDADATVTAAPMPTGTLSQDVSEDMVTEDLWDLGDGGGSDDDTLDGGHAAVMRVQVDYLKSATLRAVGTTGVDLVDFLDGWFVEAGLVPCTPAKSIVTGTRMFPYDYAGPAGACP